MTVSFSKHNLRIMLAALPVLAALLIFLAGNTALAAESGDAPAAEADSAQPATFEEFRELADSSDEQIEFTFDLFGQTVSTTGTTELRFSKLSTFDDDSLDYLREVIPYLYSLETISVYNCSVSDEAMDALRTDFPEINVRWVIYFGGFSAWSDTETIWAMAGLYHDEYAENLKYFHDLKNLDIGHNGLTTCDFLYGMPDLEVLIIACGTLEDITPVASLKKLKYIEICDTAVSDISPLGECESLEHINLGGIPCSDLSPLFSLKNVKRLFADNMTGLSESERNRYEQEFADLFPGAEISFLMGPAGGVENGFWRFSRGPYSGSYVAPYLEIRRIFGYDDDMNQAHIYDFTAF